MKKEYNTPEVEIIYLDTEDIITASVVEDNDDLGDVDLDALNQLNLW